MQRQQKKMTMQYKTHKIRNIFKFSIERRRKLLSNENRKKINLHIMRVEYKGDEKKKAYE